MKELYLKLNANQIKHDEIMKIIRNMKYKFHFTIWNDALENCEISIFECHNKQALEIINEISKIHVIDKIKFY